MRRRDEPIEVRRGRVGEGIAGLAPQAEGLEEGPAQFLWRNRLWRVLDVQERWMEAGAWWDSPGVRAARGDWEPEGLDEQAPPTADLLCEQEVWRVEAASGMSFSRGVYELVHAVGEGSWRLRAVVD